MIDDLIELAFFQDAVLSVSLATDGSDEYTLRRIDEDTSPVTVRVRPDGKFGRAVGTEGYLSLGQVMSVCGLTYRDSPLSSQSASRR